VIAALTTGFETVNARLELILLPLALDLFLWLGPHLSVKPLADQLLDRLRLPPNADVVAAQNVEALRLLLADYGQRFNLFAVLSTAPLGVPSLIAGRASMLIPTGLPLTWSVSSGLQYALLVGTFALFGLFLGALYFGSIAQQVRDARLDVRRLLRQVWRDWAGLTALAVVGIVALVALGTPVLLVSGVVSLFSPVGGGLLSLLGSTLILWLLFYAAFTLHGMILHRRGLFRALWDSLRLVHRSLPHTTGLYLAVAVIYLGLGLVWNMPGDDSWLMLFGMLGHALVSTALVAATFAYYQDRYRWWTETRQTLRARAEAGQGGANRSTKA
jgi:hypothetical protein